MKVLEMQYQAAGLKVDSRKRCKLNLIIIRFRSRAASSELFTLSEHENNLFSQKCISDVTRKILKLR